MLEPSKYLPFFKENRERLAGILEVFGDVLIVERLKFPEKKVGSLFIADSRKTQTGGFTTEVPEFFRVLHVGNGYYDDDTKVDVAVDINQGDIIHTNIASVKIWSSFPLLEITESDILGLARHGDTIARWKTEEEFFKFLTDFNLGVKAEVERQNPKE